MAHKKKKDTVCIGTVAQAKAALGAADCIIKGGGQSDIIACMEMNHQISMEIEDCIKPMTVNSITADADGNLSIETDAGKLKIDSCGVVMAQAYTIEAGSNCAASVYQVNTANSAITAITADSAVLHDYAVDGYRHNANECVRNSITVGDCPGNEFRVGDFPGCPGNGYPNSGGWYWPYQNQPWRQVEQEPDGISIEPGTMTLSGWTTAGFPGPDQPLDGKFRFIHRKKVEIGMYKNRIPIFIKRKFKWNISSTTVQSISMNTAGIPHTSRRFG